MDLEKKIDLVDDELKLLKSEIKQVLLDIQEHVLNIQNPFSAMAAADPAKESVVVTEVHRRVDHVDEEMRRLREELDPTKESALVTAVNKRVDHVDEETKRLREEVERVASGAGGAAEPANQSVVVTEVNKRVDHVDEEMRRLREELERVASGARGAAPAGSQPQAQPMAPQGPYPAAQAPVVQPVAAQAPAAAPAIAYPGPAPRAQDAIEPRDFPGPSVPAPSTSKSATSVEEELDEVDDRVQVKRRRVAAGARKTEDESDAAVPKRQSTRKRRSSLPEVHLDGEGDELELVDDPEEYAEEEDAEEEASREQDSADRKTRAAGTLDLVTIAGLATWTDQVVRSAGREHLERLLEITEIRGRLSEEIKKTILTLAQLFDDREPGGGLTAKEMVSLLAKLDALSGMGTADEARLLAVLIRGDMEDFQLTRP